MRARDNSGGKCPLSRLMLGSKSSLDGGRSSPGQQRPSAPADADMAVHELGGEAVPGSAMAAGPRHRARLLTAHSIARIRSAGPGSPASRSSVVGEPGRFSAARAPYFSGRPCFGRLLFGRRPWRRPSSVRARSGAASPDTGAVDREEHLPPGRLVQLHAARGQQAEFPDRQRHRRRDARESRTGSG
jgi:hypothetical protein